MSEVANKAGALEGRSWSQFWANPVAQWALALGILVHLAGFFAFSIETPVEVDTRVPAPQIIYASQSERQDLILAEQSSLLDFEPLFLPTSRNASIYSGAGNLVERTEPFSPLPARLLISEGQFPTVAEEFRAPIRDPIEALTREDGGSFATFGQRAAGQEPLLSRSGVVEVYREGESEAVVMQPLDSSLIEGASANLSQIPEWQLYVSAGGLVGAPLLVRGSGLEAVDTEAGRYLAEIAPTWGLPTGYYRVVMGP
ncbi:MAG: hypothetical protein ACQKBV_08345 [Puniceicoccales bacterium]